MIIQINLLLAKQRWLKEYLDQFVDALENPTNSSSLSTFAMLIRGGSPTETIDLLKDFGVPSNIVFALQIANEIQSSQNGTISPE